MNPLFKKLLLKPGKRAAFVHLPEEHRGLLAELPDGVEAKTSLSGKVDWILSFATSLGSLKSEVKRLTGALEPDGILWIAYPKAKKLSTDLNRDVLRVELEALKLNGVSLVAIDDTWSAMRFRF